MALALPHDQPLIEMKVDGQIQMVDVHAQGDRLIKGTIDGRPVILHRVRKEWFREVDGHPAPNTISVEGQIPETVFMAIADHLDRNHALSWDRVLTQALAMWVLNQGNNDRAINRAYLDAAFSDAA